MKSLIRHPREPFVLVHIRFSIFFFVNALETFGNPDLKNPCNLDLLSTLKTIKGENIAFCLLGINLG